jgi:fructose-1,6-bisphosphatase/inositol monophosphatase family enzyme
MADVEFGFVHDFGAEEEFAARRGDGAKLGGEPIEVAAEAERLEVVGLESAEPEWALPALEALAGKTYRLRVIGSIAITAAYVAAGSYDAGQLIVREAGGAVAFGDLPLEQAPLDLEARYSIAAARGPAALATVRAAQAAAAAV